jgi:serine protease Do
MREFKGMVVAAAVALAVGMPPAAAQRTAPAPRVVKVAEFGNRSFLGVHVAEIDAERAKALNLREEHGVEITRVEEDSPASKGGLNTGDVVLEYNGQRVEGTEQFIRMVRETPAGRQAKLLVNRKGANVTLAVTLGSRKDHGYSGGTIHFPPVDLPEIRIPEIRIPDVPRAYMSWRNGSLGVEVESLESQLAEYFGVKSGVLVRSVTKDSPAEKAGLKAGDVIVKVDQEKVTNPREVSSALRGAKSKTVPLVVVRNQKETTVTVTVQNDRSEDRRPRQRTFQMRL